MSSWRLAGSSHRPPLLQRRQWPHLPLEPRRKLRASPAMRNYRRNLPNRRRPRLTPVQRHPLRLRLPPQARELDQQPKKAIVPQRQPASIKQASCISIALIIASRDQCARARLAAA